MGEEKSRFPLAWATEDELIDELGRRVDGLVISVVKTPRGKTTGPAKEATYTAWRGGLVQAHGLAVMAELRTRRQLLE